MSAAPLMRIERFALERHAGPYAQWPATSRLIVDGAPRESRIKGYDIEAQYEWAGGYLVVTSFDCMFEESNTFTLLDRDYRALCTKDLETPYDTWLLHEHWPIDALTLGLHYHERHFFTLHIVPAGRWPWQRPRLRLRRYPAWRDDARMCEAHDRLQGALAAVARDPRTADAAAVADDDGRH